MRRTLTRQRPTRPLGEPRRAPTNGMTGFGLRWSPLLRAGPSVPGWPDEVLPRHCSPSCRPNASAIQDMAALASFADRSTTPAQLHLDTGVRPHPFRRSTRRPPSETVQN